MIDEIDQEAWDADLKLKERTFVLHYCADAETFLNATASYKKTYTKVDRKTGETIEPLQSTCEANGPRLCKKPRVKDAIRKLLKLTQADLDEENTYKILNELATMTFFNPADVLEADGTLRVDDLQDLGETAKVIAQIKPGIPGKTLPEVTLIDRRAYMDLMLRYLNIVRPEQQIEIKLPVVELPSKAESAEAWNATAQED